MNLGRTLPLYATGQAPAGKTPGLVAFSRLCRSIMRGVNGRWSARRRFRGTGTTRDYTLHDGRRNVDVLVAGLDAFFVT
jgi:hypothetical protein